MTIDNEVLKMTVCDLKEEMRKVAEECHTVQNALWIGIIGMYFNPVDAKEIYVWAGKTLHDNYDDFVALWGDNPYGKKWRTGRM